MKKLARLRQMLKLSTEEPWLYFSHDDGQYGPTIQGGKCGPMPPPLHILVDNKKLEELEDGDDSEWPVRMSEADAETIVLLRNFGKRFLDLYDAAVNMQTLLDMPTVSDNTRDRVGVDFRAAIQALEADRD